MRILSPTSSGINTYGVTPDLSKVNTVVHIQHWTFSCVKTVQAQLLYVGPHTGYISVLHI